MINIHGQWEENKDYSTFPQKLWCDMDFMAVWIRSQSYEPKTSMENLIKMILAHYDNEVEYTLHEDGSCTYYFAVPDERPYPDNLMVHVPDVAAYVEASGGLKEFDYVV